MPFKPMTDRRLPAEDSRIWRYMDLWKFEEMIKELALYFVRSDRFADSWDSVLPLQWDEAIRRPALPRPDGTFYTKAEWYAEREIPANPIHCWNCEASENQRMWHEYTNGPDSLVVSSTVARFKKCFESIANDVTIGLVEYGDHSQVGPPQFSFSNWGDNDLVIPPNPWCFPRWLKRSEFAFERELRASAYVGHHERPFDPGINLAIGADGIHTLIESVYVHPKATGGFRDYVESILTQSGFDAVSVNPSALT